jgi:hypothetical protein
MPRTSLASSTDMVNRSWRIAASARAGQIILPLD